ncbi:cytochrome c oxidase subunit 2 [Iodidimonas gelatinilytica]|uniref:Cytochrome c oxidase subunit 2 n=2 Tax=Iodidimonas gelatinilytica TaxID=1236966 RepID=A0A5A7MQP0_9PROT|nr:cytochrome c oxidase subunit II [Iodidimonas gelatinilytica]GEQ97275.1 cytochrome c oxidase subunit 2 [Iodidimonas gelatinilytica]
MKKLLGIIGAALFASTSGAVSAMAQVVRKGEDGHMGLQPAATPIMEQLTSFHNLLLSIITVITVMVAVLLVWVMIRYNRKSNPKPSKTSHNTLVEVVWTVVPILILVLIAIPSFKLLYLQDEIPEADLVVKATGHQWYWSYEYPDYDNMAFDALMLDEKYYTDMSSDVQGERKDAEMRLAEFLVRDEPPQTFRLLDTDTRIVVPVGKVVKMLVTASDVLHSWAIPSFGVKIDAVPGRLNETWFQADEIGTYYGQCSEICGIRHAYMPIVVEVVSEEDFKLWVEKARAEYAEAPGSTRLASAGRQVH